MVGKRGHETEPLLEERMFMCVSQRDEEEARHRTRERESERERKIESERVSEKESERGERYRESTISFRAHTSPPKAGSSSCHT